jgi:recombination protein RecA
MADERDSLKRFLANARGIAATSPVLSLDDMRMRRGAEHVSAPWGLAAMRGRLVELSARGATATLTAAIELVAEAQTQSEPVAWLTLVDGSFYPPDVAESGVDLAALVVVRAPDATAVAKSAERVLRSGAFGLVVLDLGRHGDLSMAIQGRLVTLAQTHDAAVICLTDKTNDSASIGSLVSLRAEALRLRNPQGGDFEMKVHVLKDKRRGPGFAHTTKKRGPAGLV